MEMPDKQIHALFESYRLAFSQGSPALIAKHYVYPAHIIGQGQDSARNVVVPNPTALEQISEQILARYAEVGFKSAGINNITVTNLSISIARVDLNWALMNEKNEEIFNFDTVYTVLNSEGAWKIATVVAPNEVVRHYAYLDTLNKCL